MDTRLEISQTIERWAIRFTGIVQGVGFRPLVSMLAHELGLSGFVYNDGQGVYVEVQGAPDTLELYVESIVQEQPRLCRITHSSIDIIAPIDGDEKFEIRESPLHRSVSTFISADTSPCDACLQEMNEEGRRYQYPFINCTDCGPRYSIIESMPYDRERTTMHSFTMCKECKDEYENIHGRRYHAEPNACKVCGPTYELRSFNGDIVPSNIEGSLQNQNVLQYAAQLVAGGAIIAVKGVGGYHLVCDATNDEAVARLRERKNRPHKPFAVMAGSMEILESFVSVSNAELDAITHMARPIVLLEKLQSPTVTISEWVAPDNHLLGVMLPYAPIHYALIPKEAVWVMTSGNMSGDAVIYDDQQAIDELGHIVDYILTHNRSIYAPVDDSLVSVMNDRPLMIRRSRGYVPEPIHCHSLGSNTMLAMGSDLKNTFAINRNQEVLLSPHIGDLGSESVHSTYEWTIDRYEQLFELKPEALIIDSHPGFFSSTRGRDLSSQFHIPLLEVQHHHSHIASVMAEHNLNDTVLGVCFDGTGYGDDGTIWGGEFLVCQGAEYRRVAHLHMAPLPGGEQAVREPWRQALWYVRNHYGSDLPTVYDTWMNTLPSNWQILDKALQSPMPMMMTSSMGRLFDAVGCLLGLGNIHTYDAQVAIALEAACKSEKGNLLDFNYDGQILDLVPLVNSLMDSYANGESVASLAASFHKTLSIAVCEVAADICKRYDIDKVALGGGVFQNRRLLGHLYQSFHHGQLYINEQVPCNDGGLALGQLWIGHQKLKSKH